MLVRWLVEPEQGVRVVPFDTVGEGLPSGTEIYDRLYVALAQLGDDSDLEAPELPSSAVSSDPLRPAPSEGLRPRRRQTRLLSQQNPIASALDGFGTLRAAGAEVPIGRLVLMLRELLGHRAPTISGCLSRYGPTIRVVARIERRGGVDSLPVYAEIPVAKHFRIRSLTS